MTHRLRFPQTAWPDLEVEEDAPLSEVLDASNSPVLFGCRTGICGTCIVTVAADGALPPPDEDEAEILDIHAPDTPGVRLACQLKVRASCAIEVPPP